MKYGDYSINFDSEEWTVTKSVRGATKKRWKSRNFLDVITLLIDDKAAQYQELGAALHRTQEALNDLLILTERIEKCLKKTPHPKQDTKSQKQN